MIEKLCEQTDRQTAEDLYYPNAFIERNEMNSHNQTSQFKKAVILSKEKPFHFLQIHKIILWLHVITVQIANLNTSLLRQLAI